MTLVYIGIYQLFGASKMWNNVTLKRSLTGFSRRENTWLYILPKGISTMSNANTIVKDLNSVGWV